MTTLISKSLLHIGRCYGRSLKEQFSSLLLRRASSTFELHHDKTSTTDVSRFPVHNIKDLPITTQELLYNVDDKSGFIPNLYHAMANRPEQFKSFIQYRNSITRREKCKLKKEDFELIGLATSVKNGCMYCIIAHSALHRSFSRNRFLSDQVVANIDGAELTDRQRAIVSLALAVSKCEPITEQHFLDLAIHGLDMEDAWDIAAMAAFTLMANSLTTFLKVKPNKEYYNMGR